MTREDKLTFKNWYELLTETDQLKIKHFFQDVYDNLVLNKKDTKLMILDFEKAFLYYSRHNIDIDKSIELLSTINLGNFYKKDTNTWYPLDYAAKIYPLSMRKNWMAVFRLSVYLKEDIVPEILQMALTFTIKRFPYFATTIRRGFFWHYIDSSKKRYYVKPEHNCPCSPMNISNTGSPSFRVYYFNNRISVEFFHILTDGNGGTIFLTTLVNEYLRLLNKDVSFNTTVLNTNEIPLKEEASNDFLKPVKTKKGQGFFNKQALQIDGKSSNVKPCQILHFDMSSKEVISLAHKKDVTVTTLMLGFIFMVCKYSTSKNGTISIQVPINMRKTYNSITMRNFALYVIINIKRNEINDFDDLLKEIKKQLDEKTTIENMEQVMKSTARIVSSLKFIPLFIKKPIARIVYGFLGDKVFTTTLSNIGVVNLPDNMKSEVTKMDFVLGTAITNKAMFSMVTVNDTLTLSVAKLTTNSALELNLYSLFLKEGLNPLVFGSETYENRN